MKPRFVAPSRVRPPASRPFQHEDKCRTKDAELEWIEERSGVWCRTCSCTVEYWYPPAAARRGPEVDPARHRHDPGCTMTAVVKEGPDGGKFTFCPLCETYTHVLRLPDDPQDREEFLAGLRV